ncbi:MAG: hypothetical protein EON52_03110 [Actinomycetales bacterium]|nr:MAG: hypothetical protein EON52_03110 [Actinomycetales bacterium]
MSDSLELSPGHPWAVDPDAPGDDPFEIHRRTWVYALFAIVPLLLAAGFAWFAYDRDDVVLWAPAAVLVLLGLIALPGISDGRTPLFVADGHGVRLRDGHQWVGLLWTELADVRVERREGRHDPRVKVVSPAGERIFTAPLGFATSMSPAEAEVQLARRRPGAAYTEMS